MSEASAHRVAETAARSSYGRLLAILAAGSRDIAAAEDALADAFAAALTVWPERGVPDNPEAWLLTAARNKLRNQLRHLTVLGAAAEELARRSEDAERARAPAALDAPFPDERLKLLFVCAHPAIDESVRTPLMLQAVLGLDAQRIASAFVVAPTTMGQRLVRAKAKIRDAGLSFTIPDAEHWPERLSDVLSAVYVAYGAGWDGVAGADEGARDLTEEAIFLGRLLVSLLPEEPEAKGLLSLMLFCESRRAARRDEHGRFVPLDSQDAARWDARMVVEAERLLTGAAAKRTFGRFQCEAAIQSVHAQRAITGEKNHAALRTLYDLLLAHEPSLGVHVGRAAVLLDAGEMQAAAQALQGLARDAVQRYQPYWVTRARLHELSGDTSEARAALRVALGLTEDAAVRAFLQTRLEALGA
jgi:RNA polymerase sigma-70 factor (ECF subfamily)